MATIQKIINHLETIDQASAEEKRLKTLRCVNLFQNKTSGKTNKTYHFESEKDYRFVTIYNNENGTAICWGIAVHIAGRKYKYFQDKEKGKMYRCLEFLAEETEPILREKYDTFFASQINSKFSELEIEKVGSDSDTTMSGEERDLEKELSEYLS